MDEVILFARLTDIYESRQEKRLHILFIYFIYLLKTTGQKIFYVLSVRV